MSIATVTTAEQLLRMPYDGFRYELVEGELRTMSPAGWRHGEISAELVGRLIRYAREGGLGKVFSTETGFLLTRDPDTVRAPDAAFIAKDHLPTTAPQDAYWPGAPDLAVEVISPSDTTGETDEKVKSWLDAGTQIVWLVNPKWRSVTVYRSATDITTLTENDELSGEQLLPGFRCRVGEIFG